MTTATTEPVELTPDEQARKDSLQATAAAAEAGTAAQAAADEREQVAEAAETLTDLRKLVEWLRDDAQARPSNVGKVAAMTLVKRELERSLKSIKRELEPLNQAVLDEFADRGVTSMRDAATGKTVSMSRKVWARRADGIDSGVACEGLEAAGLGDFVEQGFNTHSLSGYFRELVKERMAEGDPVDDLDELLPEPLRGLIALTDDQTVGVAS